MTINADRSRLQFAAADDGVDPRLVPKRRLYPGAEIPAVGVGTFGSDPTPLRTRFTAPVRWLPPVRLRRGVSERSRDGEVFDEVFRTGLVREQVWVTSKLWNDKHSEDDAILGCRQSLRELRCAYVGEGTEFDILLPCCESPAERPSPPCGSISEAPPAERPATILVVEDEEALRQAAVKVLRKLGFVILEAATGTAAVDLLHSHASAIDAILVDMTISGRSSVDVLAVAGTARPGIKVLLTSAYSEDSLRRSFAAFSASPFG